MADTPPAVLVLECEDGDVPLPLDAAGGVRTYAPLATLFAEYEALNLSEPLPLPLAAAGVRLVVEYLARALEPGGAEAAAVWLKATATALVARAEAGEPEPLRQALTVAHFCNATALDRALLGAAAVALGAAAQEVDTILVGRLLTAGVDADAKLHWLHKDMQFCEEQRDDTIAVTPLGVVIVTEVGLSAFEDGGEWRPKALACAQLLLGAGADATNVNCVNGAPVIHSAVSLSFPAMITLLVRQDSSLVEVRDPRGDGGNATPLLRAVVMKGDDEDEQEAKRANVAALLESGADVNALDSSGRSVLFHAKPFLSKMLIEAGADVHRVSPPDGLTKLQQAAYFGEAKTCTLLAQAGADLEYRECSLGEPSIAALHFATQNNANTGDEPLKLATVKALVEAGANVNVLNANSWTPLHYSVQKGFPDITKYLIEHGADINAASTVCRCNGTNGMAFTAASTVSRAGPPAVPCDCWMKNGGDTPIMVASNSATAQQLIDAGCDVNATKEDGTNALFNAVTMGYADVCKVLAAVGADLDATFQSEFGLQTALDVAIELNHAATRSRILHDMAALYAHQRNQHNREATVLALREAGRRERIPVRVEILQP